MTGDECKKFCNELCSSTTITATPTDPAYAQILYGTTVYSAPWQPPQEYIPRPYAFDPLEDTSGTTLRVTPYPDEDPEDEYLEMVEEKKIRELLSEIFLFLSGMGEYPELLAQICPQEIVGSVTDPDEAERELVPERVVAQVLRWVLGEL